jgi:hypothetical protein
VRSSYRAGEFFIEAFLEERASGATEENALLNGAPSAQQEKH